MREYKIYFDGNGPETMNFKKFARELQKEINADFETIKFAKKVNTDFSKKAAEILSNPDNFIFAGSMIEGAMNSTPRYIYKKNVQNNGKNYDIEIDLLLRQFSIIEL